MVCFITLSDAGAAKAQVDSATTKRCTSSWKYREVQYTARLYLCERFDALVARRIASLEAKATG